MLAPLIHIGYPKTGTTWLQDYVFQSSVFEYFATKPILKQYLNPAFSIDTEEANKILARRIEIVQQHGKYPVLSSEWLVSDLCFNRHQTDIIGPRLHTLFPNGKILIVFREQRTWLLSMYQQNVRACQGVYSLSQFIEKPYIDFSFMRYVDLIEYYQKLFGSENVLAMPYEWFRQDSPLFVNKILVFLEIPQLCYQLTNELPFSRTVNQARSPIEVHYYRLHNKLFGNPSQLNPNPLYPSPRMRNLSRLLLHQIRPHFPKQVNRNIMAQWKAQINDVLDGYFIESNRQLANLLDIDLESLGYDI